MNEPIKAKIVETPKFPRRYIGVEAHIDERAQVYDATFAYKKFESAKKCYGYRDMTIYELPGSDEIPWTEERVKEVAGKFIRDMNLDKCRCNEVDLMEFAKRLGVI